MELSLKIDPEAKLRILKLTGQTTMQDLYDAIEEVYRHPGFDHSHNSVWDLRECSLADLTSEAVQQIASSVAAQRKARGAPPKGALVVSKDLDYGMARMYETYLDSGSDFGVFRDIDEAMEWLMSNTD